MSADAAREDPPGDLYAYQRQELEGRLESLSRAHEPFSVHERERLTADEVTRCLWKIRRGFGFSRRERAALSEAGFDLDRLFPHA